MPSHSYCLSRIVRTGIFHDYATYKGSGYQESVGRKHIRYYFLTIEGIPAVGTISISYFNATGMVQYAFMVGRFCLQNSIRMDSVCRFRTYSTCDRRSYGKFPGYQGGVGQPRKNFKK